MKMDPQITQITQIFIRNDPPNPPNPWSIFRTVQRMHQPWRFTTIEVEGADVAHPVRTPRGPDVVSWQYPQALNDGILTALSRRSCMFHSMDLG
jgi:hypothetical protein